MVICIWRNAPVLQLPFEFPTIVRNSYVHVRNHLHMLMITKSEVEILNSLKLLQDSQGNGRFGTDSQDRLRTLDSE